MRVLTVGLAAAGLVGLGALVMLAGKTIALDSDALMGASEAVTETDEAVDVDSQVPGPDTQPRLHPARSVGKDIVAEPETSGEALVRDEPREPLSTLSQALPPPEPEITLFHRPVATASASFEAMGYKLTIAGTESVSPEETCTYEGVTWPCGIRARTAVRMWLRGRALTCEPPPKGEDKVAVVSCRLGNQDVGAWLVSNGWARAAAGGPYAEAEEQARKAGIGIFGRPSQTSG